jgi:hypothetical protein
VRSRAYASTNACAYTSTDATTNACTYAGTDASAYTSTDASTVASTHAGTNASAYTSADNASTNACAYAGTNAGTNGLHSRVSDLHVVAGGLDLLRRGLARCFGFLGVLRQRSERCWTFRS